MKRELTLLFAMLCYILSILCIAYSIGFLGNVLVPRSIDSAALVALGDALAVNVGLILVFTIQRSALARPSFKRWLARWSDPAIHRSLYILASSFAMLFLMALWQPMGGIVWSLHSPVAIIFTRCLYAAGWALMFYATLSLNHFELFGVRQAWVAYEGGLPVLPKLRTPGLYRCIRHPINLGWLLILWSAPTMTVTHLLLAAGMTIYILVGIQLEERDLEAELPEYRQYKRKVPMLLPSWSRRLRDDEQQAGDIFESQARCILSHERRGRLRHRFSLKF